MASIKRGDTYPPLRGAASDEDGLKDMTSADLVVFLMKHNTGLPNIRGTIWSGGSAVAGTIIAPPGDEDGFNWAYNWAPTDTAQIGRYTVELEISWDVGHTQIETIPNGENPILEIVQDNG